MAADENTKKGGVDYDALGQLYSTEMARRNLGDTQETMQSQETGSYQSNRGATAPSTTDTVIPKPRNAPPPTKAVATKKVAPKKEAVASNIPVTTEQLESAPTFAEGAPQEPQDKERDIDGIVDEVLRRKNPNNQPEQPQVPQEAIRPELGRFNFNMQYGLTMPHYIDEWRRNAEEENHVGNTAGAARTARDARAAAANERVQQMRRNQISSNWDKTWANVRYGGYDDKETGEFNREKLITDLASLVNSYERQGGFADELAKYGENRGGFKARDAMAIKEAKNANDMAFFAKDLATDLSVPGQYIKKKGTYDSIINNIQRILGNAGSTQADADKIRVQYLYLPKDKMEEYLNEYEKYMKSLAQTASQAGKRQDALAIMSNLQTAREGAAGALSGESPEYRIQKSKQMYDALKDAQSRLFEYSTVIGANKLAFDTYVHNLVMQASIDPEFLASQLTEAYNLSVKRYNDIVSQRGGIPLKPRYEMPSGFDFSNYYKENAEDKWYSHDYAIPERVKPPQDASTATYGRKGTR